MTKMTLIIRPQPDADRDVALLARYGVPALASPSMTCFLQLNELPGPARFSGIILTSRNAVDAITKSNKKYGLPYFMKNTDTNQWIKLPAFVVGTATATAARDAGFSNIIVGKGGGLGLLTPISHYFNSKMGKEVGGTSGAPRLFWPSAFEISFDMVAALAGQGVVVERLPVYQMIANDKMDPKITDKIAQGAISAVVAMSPRSAQIFRDNLAASGKEFSLKRVSLIAGSAKIVAAAGTGWKAVYIARQPRRSRLLAIAVLQHQRNR